MGYSTYPIFLSSFIISSSLSFFKIDLDDNENIPTTNTFQISCNGANDGAINITPSGGSGSYTFNWSSNVSNSGIVQGQEDQSGLGPGSYSVSVTDSNGANATETKRILDRANRRAR